MYYEQSSSKTFIIAFLTSLIVSVVINIIFFFILHNPISLFTTIEIPNLKGLDFETARQIVESKGLTLIIEKEVEDEIMEKGKIVSQNPILGSKLKKGEIVKVIVSKGRYSKDGEVIVPILTELTISQARMRLSELNLTIGTIKMEVSDLPESTIIRTIPSAGEKVPINFPVNLIISAGKGETIVPKITGLTLNQARIRLEEAGLVLGNTNSTTDPEYSFDIIIRQHPPSGTKVKKGTKVDVTINVEEY